MSWEAKILPVSPRAREWMEVLGTLTVRVLDPLPVRNCACGGYADFYRLDVASLSVEQRDRLCAHLTKRFDLPAPFVQHLMDNPDHGVPILADDVYVPLPLAYVV